MFEKKLLNDLSKIFQFKKTTYNSPSDEYEQDTLFVNITSCISRVSEYKYNAKVEGNFTVFSRGEKLPFGFFAKKIELAPKELTNDKFFTSLDTDIESSPSRLMDIHERRGNFIYLFSDQYDPNKGDITSFNIATVEIN